MACDLIKNGCIPNKSLIISFPTLDIVPKELLRHFIRGYFDGDGCICFAKSGISINVISTEDFLNDMCDEVGLIRNKYSRHGKAYGWQSASKATITKFLNYMYKDAKIYLDRKYEKYLRYAVLNRDI
jgi:intein/homing endonuclease